MNTTAVFAAPLLSALLAAPGAVGQEKDTPPPARPAAVRKAGTPLRLHVVFARYQGDRKVSSLPYTLALNSDGRPARIRMGIQVPLRQRDVPAEVVYRDVGNNLDCNAESLADDRYRVACVLEQSSVYTTTDRDASAGQPPISSLPVLRTFRSEAQLHLRTGETGQYTTATDPVNGEVLKIEMTLEAVR